MGLQAEIDAALDRRITYDTRPGHDGAVMLYVAAPMIEETTCSASSA
jgi:hypothetical protein